MARLAAERELELAKLIRLKPAGGLETLAERQELERRHRLENVELGDEHLENGQDALERVLRPVRVVGLEQQRRAIDLVQDLLEPELVDLVNDDEEQLVVLGPFGARALEIEQLVDVEVAAVGDRRIHHFDYGASADRGQRPCALGARLRPAGDFSAGGGLGELRASRVRFLRAEYKKGREGAGAAPPANRLPHRSPLAGWSGSVRPVGRVDAPYPFADLTSLPT